MLFVYTNFPLLRQTKPNPKPQIVAMKYITQHVIIRRQTLWTTNAYKTIMVLYQANYQAFDTDSPFLVSYSFPSVTFQIHKQQSQQVKCSENFVANK